MHTVRTNDSTDTTAASAAPPRRSRTGRWVARGAIALGLGAVLAAGGVAFAAWNVTGSGEGSAAAAQPDPLTDVTVSIAAALYPGLTTDAKLTVRNPNPFPVRLTDIEFKALSVFDDEDVHATCTAVNSAVMFNDITGVDDDEYFIDADTTEEFELEGAVQMGSAASDACQGASFKVEVDLTAESTTPAP